MRIAVWSALASIAPIVVGTLLAPGCNNPRYVQENRPLEAQAAAMAMPGDLLTDTDLFVLPIRQPTADEAQRLADEQTRLGPADARALDWRP